MNLESGIVKVFIVAASLVARAGLESVLHDDANFVVAGSAAEISAAPSVFSNKAAAFDVLLINVERRRDFNTLLEFLSDNSGDESAANSPPSVVALLAPDFQTGAQAVQLLRGGARGVLRSDAAREAIAAAINAAANDLIVVAPEMQDALFPAGENFPLDGENDFSNAESVESLTVREREVLEMLVEGASNKSIARRMSISEHTVKFHVASIFGKLGANSRTEAVTAALRRGLILL